MPLTPTVFKGQLQLCNDKRYIKGNIKYRDLQEKLTFPELLFKWKSQNNSIVFENYHKITQAIPMVKAIIGKEQ